MKVAVFATLVTSTAAFSAKETSRREAFAGVAAAGAALVPAAANAVAGDSPKFSVFGIVGDGSSYSEGAAYGSDQSTKVYSPYSVYGETGGDSLYKTDTAGYAERNKAILAESKVRLSKLSAYAEKKQWFNVRDELTRYMYETRGAVRRTAKSTSQKEKADVFFKAIEEVFLTAGLKQQDKCLAAISASQAAFDAYVASI